MASFIILGDPHIGGSLSLGKIGLGSTLNSRITDRMQLLDWVLEQAVNRDIDTIIITGDVFEEVRPPPVLIALFIGWLKSCEANKIFVHIVIGNHDILRTGNYYTSSLDIISECELPNVSIHKEMTTVQLGTTNITFLPFRDRKSFNVESNAIALKLLQQKLIYELASIPRIYTKIVIGHFAIEGSIYVGDEIDDLTNELHCPIEMFRGYDYVYMGHVHRPQVLNDANPHVAHIGSMDISNFGETDHTKHIIIYDDEAEEEIEKVIIPTRPLHKIVISIPSDTKDCTKYVIDEIKQNYPSLAKAIVKLEIHLAGSELIPTNRGDIERFLYSLNVCHVASISESKKMTDIKKEATLDTKIDTPAAIKLWAETQIEAANQSKFIEIALDIWQEYQGKI